MRSSLDVRTTHEIDHARIDDDEFRALAKAALQLRGEHRMTVGGIGPDHHDDIGLHHGREGLRACRFAQRVLEAVTGGRVTDPRAGIHVVGAERRAHQFLHEESLLVRAA